MEFARGELEAVLLVQLGVERLVVEGGLDRVLAVVEVAAHAEDADVVAALRDHLLALDVGDAVGGVEDDDARVLAVGEALERRLAGVARGGHEHQVVVGRARRAPACASTASEKNSGMHCSAMSLNALVGPCHSSSTCMPATTSTTGAMRASSHCAPYACCMSSSMRSAGTSTPKRAKTAAARRQYGQLGEREDLVERERRQLLRARTGRRRARCPSRRPR